MTAPFMKQSEANQYVQGIRDPTERLLTSVALNRAIGVWLADPVQRNGLAQRPIDLLAFVVAAHAFFQDRAVLEGILKGEISSLDDLDPFGS